MRLFLLGIVAILVSLSLSTWADSAPNETTSIEEITVTAHRVPVAAVPVVHQINSQVMQRRGRSMGADILETLPGLTISRAGAFGTLSQVRVRGAEANHLQVLIDGIEVNDPAIGSEFDFAHLNLAGIDRIEFLPGAQSALWGSDAVAGVVNLISVPQERRRELALTGGSFDTRQTRVELADVFNRGYYTLAASHYDTDGTNISLRGNEDDGYQNTTFHFNGGISGETVGANLVLRRTDSETDIDPAPFPISVPVDGDEQTELTQTAAKIELTADLFDNRWQSALSVIYLKTENNSLSDSLVTSEVNGKRVKISFDQHLRLNDNHFVTVILEREEEDFSQRGIPSFFGNPNQDQEFRSNGVSLEHRGHWGRLSTALSARFDSNDKFEDAASYRANARYRITDQIETIVALGTGIKNPSFFERFGFTPDTFVGNPNLDPEENRHRSLSLRYRNKITNATITYFNDQLKDEINGFAPNADFTAFTAVNLSEDSSRDGLELQVRSQLGTVDVSAGYMYLNAEDPDGQDEMRRPRHSGHLQVGVPFAADKGYLQIGSTFTGKQIDTDFRSFTPVTLDKHYRVHINGSYQLTSYLQLSARVENAIDDDNEDIFMFRAPKRAYFLTLVISQ